MSWAQQYPALLYPGEQRVVTPEQSVFERTSYPLSWRSPLGWWRTGRHLRRTCDAVVLVLVTPLQAPALAVLARALAPVPVVVLCHNVLPHERRPLDVRLVSAVLGRAASILVHSQAEAGAARSLSSTTVAVAPLPAPHTFSSAVAAPAQGRPVQRTLLFFGMVRPYKGLDVLLHAMATVPGIRLLVHGEFWGGSSGARQLVAELGLDDRVELREGYVDADAVPGLFTQADALVLPYRTSTASWNASLGHEHGLPVVATRVGTMDQQVRDGEDGLLCAPDDAASLAGALRRLYEPGVLDALREGVRPAASAEQWDAYVATVDELLRSATT